MFVCTEISLKLSFGNIENSKVFTVLPVVFAWEDSSKTGKKIMWLDNYGLMSLLHPSVKIHQQPNRTLDARWLICLLCNWLRLSYSQIKSFVNMFIADHRWNKSQSKIPASYRWEIWIKSSPSMLFYILAMAIHVVIYSTFIDQTTKSVNVCFWLIQLN